MGPNFEPLPTSELAILLSIFHPSLRQAERAKLQVLLIIECSILICIKTISAHWLGPKIRGQNWSKRLIFECS